MKLLLSAKRPNSQHKKKQQTRNNVLLLDSFKSVSDTDPGSKEKLQTFKGHKKSMMTAVWLMGPGCGLTSMGFFFIFLFCLVYALFLLHHNFSLPLGRASFANGFFFFHNKKLALLAGLFCMLHNCTTRWYGKYGSRINCLTLKCDQASLKKASQWNNYIVYRNRLTIAIIIGGECSAAFLCTVPHSSEMNILYTIFCWYFQTEANCVTVDMHHHFARFIC